MVIDTGIWYKNMSTGDQEQVRSPNRYRNMVIDTGTWYKNMSTGDQEQVRSKSMKLDPRA